MTLWYRSPEVLMGLSYATPVDIWSCGCIMAELNLRRAFLNGQYEMDQLNKIFDVIGTPSEEDWPEKAAMARSNFKSCPKVPLANIIPGLEGPANELIEVRIRSSTEIFSYE